LRIGFFNSYKVWGGGEKWHYEMMEQFIAHNDECVLFAPFDGELYHRVKKNFSHVESHSIQVGKYTYLNPVDQLSFIKLFKKNKVDILIFNSFVDIRAAALAAKKAGVKKIVLRVGTPIAPAQKKSYIRSFQKGVDYIVGISDEIINIFKNDAPDVVSNIAFHKIENGIDVDRIVPMDIEHSTFTFGNCSRLTDQKGFPFLIQSVEKLKELTSENFKVKIAGTGEDQELLEKLVQEKGLSDTIEFVGHVEDIEHFYNDLDALAFTSKFEGTARTVLEAWSTELPVISYNVSSMKEMIEDGKDGFLIPPFDTETYAHKMKEIVENPKKYKSFGKSGREKVMESYNKKKQYRKWYDYLTSL
tara:strand:+ start:6892 stop:7968 length:1077 start_codon:yes stop_codon:yes gene_type:complete